jgi:parallel beta-helix repeat protein
LREVVGSLFISRRGRGRGAATASRRRTRISRVFCLCIVLVFWIVPASTEAAGTADEIHYTYTSQTSVSFDWRGTATDIRYGPTTSYGTTVTSHPPTPMPFSSPGPYQEADLTGLSPGTTYHYSIGGGADFTFSTAPTGNFRFDVIADVGSSQNWSNVAPTQSQIAADNPAFVLMDGDLTYAEPLGQAAVDQHFNDVMAWSQQAAYMPAWGNHDWESPSFDDLRNYKGRLQMPNAQTSSTAPAPGCCGDDWGWFDAGGVRFISYPEPYTNSTWLEWQSQAAPIFAAAQADPSIHFIVTFGHRPAYSTGVHPGDTALAGIMNGFGDTYSKYVLNFNGHSHDYERYQPIHGVTHITAAGGGSALETPWSGVDSRTAYRALHLEHVRVDVSSTGMRIDAICGPPTSHDDMTCVQGSVIDTYTIGLNPPPPPPPPPVLYVDKGNSNCNDGGSGTATQPFCTIKPAASRVVAGQTVLVGSGTYNEGVTLSSSGTATAPITFAAAPGATPTVTGGGGASSNGFYVSGKSYITIQGFSVTGTGGDGIVVKNSTNVVLQSNHVFTCGQPAQGKTAKGIRLDGATNSVVASNTVDHNTDYGIYLVNASNFNQVVSNTSFQNARVIDRAGSGIRVYGSTNNTIAGNVSHDNEDSGIEFFGAANNNLVANNLVYNNGDHGIDDNASTGQRLIGNTAYHNVTAGLNLEGGSTGGTIANNISMDNGIASPRTHSNIRVDSASVSGTTMDYNLVYLSTPDVMYIWNSVNYSSLAALKAATTQEAHGLQGLPRFASAAGGNFDLTAGSPAIDSANSAASGQSSTDADGQERSDDPATANTGAGPRTFDDRGAYEFSGTPLDHIAISPTTGSSAAGATKTYTAQAFDTGGNSFDVTSSTTFTIAPDGSCSANVCTATTSGPHTVTANDQGFTSTASLTVTPGPLDHLALSPSSATIAAGAAQTYTADGRDQYNNSLGDVTSTTTFSISPDGSCTGASCTAATSGAHTVTGTKSGKTGTASLTVSAGAIDHIVISPSAATITAGGSQSYTAQAFDTAGNPVADVTAFTTFSISPNGSCLGATCTATAAGVHTVTGNDSGKTSTATLTVNAGTLDHLAVSPSSGTIAAGSSQTYSVEGRDQYDNSLGDVTASTTFSIGPDGSCTGASCTATAAGAHTISATNSGKTGTASLTVTAAALDHLVLSPSSATITSGQSQTYTAQGRDQYNNSLGDVTASTTFSIAPDGSCTGASCTATAAGAHTVTGTSSGKTGTASLQVNPAVVDHIVISPKSATVSAGSAQAYTAQGFDAANNSLGDVTAFTTFSISPDGACIGASCTATAAGPHTVTANDGGKTDSATLTVTVGPLDHLALSPASATITAGGTQAFTADGRDQYDNSLGDMTSTTTFSIAPNGSCTGATCTASTAGTHTVTGTKSGKTGTASLQVNAASVDHIVISPASATIGAGGSQTYTVQAFDAGNNSLGDVTSSSTFTIGPNGSCSANVCTATAAGSHTVTANSSGKTSTSSLSVTAGALDHLALSPASATISAGGSQAFTADGRDQYDNSLGDVTGSTTFSIAPDGSCTGASCTATAAGAHTVTGTSSGKTGTASLQVTASATLDHIVITPSSATISAGGSQTYTAEGFDAANNSLGDVTSNTTFSITPNGSCTGNTCTATVPGAHTVTGTDAGKTSTSTLTVNAGPLDHLALSPASSTIASGGSQTYTAQGRDQYDNNLGDVTGTTTFTIAPNGSCTGATCTATTSGAHTVTGTSGGKTGTASLQVGAGALDHIVISPAAATISAGTSQAYTAQGFDSSNNSLGDVTAFTTFSISPEGVCTGASCTANAGGPHTVTGNDGGKTSTASLSVSYVKNPGFETDLSGWNTSGSGTGVTLTRVSGGHTGSWAAFLTNGATSAVTCAINDSPDWVKPTIAGTYTGTIWARADTPGKPLKLRFREYSISSGALLGTATSQITLSTSWQQVTVTYSVTTPGASSLDFNAYLSSADAPPGPCFYVDDASVTTP